MRKRKEINAWGLFDKGGIVEDGLVADTPAFCIYPLKRFAEKELQESEWIRRLRITWEED